jgi:transposase
MERSHVDEAVGASLGSTTEPTVELTDEQWTLIADLFPELPRSPKGGRPPATSRACFAGVCWVLKTGARWKDLPKCFPSSSTCWRVPSGLDAQRCVGESLVASPQPTRPIGGLGHDRVYATARFVRPKKGAVRRQDEGGKGTKILVLGDAGGLPWGVHLTAPARTKSL